MLLMEFRFSFVRPDLDFLTLDLKVALESTLMNYEIYKWNLIVFLFLNRKPLQFFCHYFRILPENSHCISSHEYFS